MSNSKQSKTAVSIYSIKQRDSLGLFFWPQSLLGWFRIPATVGTIASVMGLLKYYDSVTFKTLKPFNLPSMEACYGILLLSLAIYLLCVLDRFQWLKKLSPEQPARTPTVIAQQWHK